MKYERIRAGECNTSREVLVRSIESGAAQVLLEAGALPPSFYDLSSGAAGDLVQGIVNSRIQVAVLEPTMTSGSNAFQAFVKEANRGRSFRFFESESEAETWLAEKTM